MDGVWYAAIAAVFVLGLLFLRSFTARKARASDQRRNARAAVQPATVDATGAAGALTPSDTPPGTASAEAVPVADNALVPASIDTATSAEAGRIDADADADAGAGAGADAGANDGAGLRRDRIRSELRGEVVGEVRAEIRAGVRDEVHAEMAHLVSAARLEGQTLLVDARRDAAAHVESLDAELRRSQAVHRDRVNRLDEAERLADAREARVEARAAQVYAEEARLAGVSTELDLRRRSLDSDRAELVHAGQLQQQELERIGGLTGSQARAEVLAEAQVGARRDAAKLSRSIEDDARSEATDRARGIVAEAVQRVASAQTTETVVSVLHLPSDDLKGRIIGREGRNIRAFEAVTGVNVLIDDTPEAVLLSCFDPVRREVGRRTLERLVADGRIHPQRIEDAYEQSRSEVAQVCLRAAKDALVDVGIGDVDDRLLPILGRLRYRTSYGQNVLAHLVETAHIAGVMAAELGVDVVLVKRCAFLHDIGKALTHEVEGSHAVVGAQLLRKYGEREDVAHAVEAHHNEVHPATVEAVLTQASDTCSAARPGARRESVEAYVTRLTRIEELAGARAGVSKVFAMQSGREVRVMVAPDEVDDLAASVLAREIAKQIEDELTYPGQIRVTVVRESRATEIAH